MHFVGIVSFVALLPLVAVAGGCQELPMNDVPIADVGAPTPTSRPEHNESHELVGTLTFDVEVR